MPAVITRGTFSAKAFGFTGRTATPVYIEDVFSTYLYTGTGSDQVLTTGIDLSTKGGLVWSKRRSAIENHFLQDTLRGLTARLSTNATTAQTSSGSWPMNALSTTGMTVSGVNYAAGGETYVSWTFREQPKFFDVVTYTGSGSGAQNIAHNLGCVPGMILTKLVSGGDTSGVGGWGVYHKSLGATSVLELNSTVAAATDNWYNANPTSTTFQVFGNDPHSNRSGGTYVAYLFADSNSGGFGLSGSDSVVACGSATTDASLGEATVNLGWEPQWLLLKNSQTAGYDWVMADNMRGIATLASSNMATLLANTSGAQTTASYVELTATGFKIKGGFGASQNVIYLAIRRGPMKVPTSATNYYQPIYNPTNLSNQVNGTVGPIDLTIQGELTGAFPTFFMTAFDRLRGSVYSVTSTTAAETTGSVTFDTQVGVINGAWFSTGGVVYNFARAPGYMDVVCYTGNGTTNLVSHNLTVKPEVVIIKNRTAAALWPACFLTKGLTLNTTGTEAGVDVSTHFTSTTISVGTGGLASNYGAGPTNTSARKYVAYLFATCPGVSKVGSYTGTGAAQNINCGFSASARYVLIKRTDSAGDWYVYDSARGISSGNDPYLLLNSGAAQVTGTNYVDTFASGFALTATAPAGLNANGGSYIFLAIA